MSLNIVSKNLPIGEFSERKRNPRRCVLRDIVMAAQDEHWTGETHGEESGGYCVAPFGNQRTADHHTEKVNRRNFDERFLWFSLLSFYQRDILQLKFVHRWSNCLTVLAGNLQYRQVTVIRWDSLIIVQVKIKTR